MVGSLQAVKEFVKLAWTSRAWPKRPQTINFEITAACDAKCIHCPRQDMDRPMKAMPMPIYERLIDQAHELGVPRLCPNGYGEICTIPMDKLAPYFNYISQKKYRFRVLINTNGNRMNEERADLFIKHGVSLINVTIDGATAATAESIRVNLNFNQIEENIKRLLAMRKARGKKYPKVRVGMVAMAQTIPEIPQFLEKWRGIADFVGIGSFSSRLNTVAKANRETELVQIGSAASASPKPAACVLPFKDLNIWADGKAVLCCEDWNEELVVGDLATQTLREIWLGPIMMDARRKHMAGHGHDISLCAKCAHWQPVGPGARLWS